MTYITAKAAVIGTIRHDMFERCLTHHNFSREFVSQHAPSIIRDHAEQLIGCGIYNERETIKDILKIQPQLDQFARKFTSIGQDYGNGSTLEGYGISPTVKFHAKSVQDTEEGTISTELGLKGFIDATVEARIKGSAVQRTIHGNERPTAPHTALMSIELKTGHRQTPQMNHVAQLSLYTLTLRSCHGTFNRYDTDNIDTQQPIGAANGGMLLYLNHESLNAQHVSPQINEIKSLLSQRNSLATQIKQAAKPRGVRIQYEKAEQETQLKKRYINCLFILFILHFSVISKYALPGF